MAVGKISSPDLHVSVTRQARAGAFAETLEEEVADFAGVELFDKRRKRGRRVKTHWVPMLGAIKQPVSPEGVALRWMTCRAAELQRRANTCAWEHHSALCNVPPRRGCRRR